MIRTIVIAGGRITLHMDVAEDIKDVKLYRNSADLIQEIKTKIPKLVWRPHTDPIAVRRWVLDSKTDELVLRVSITKVGEAVK